MFRIFINKDSNTEVTKNTAPRIGSISIINQTYYNRVVEIKNFICNYNSMNSVWNHHPTYINDQFYTPEAANHKLYAYFHLITGDEMPVLNKKTSRYEWRVKDEADKLILSNLAIIIDSRSADVRLCHRFHDKKHPYITIKDYCRMFEFAMKTGVINPVAMTTYDISNTKKYWWYDVLVGDRTLKYPVRMWSSGESLRSDNIQSVREDAMNVIENIEALRSRIILIGGDYHNPK